ncbi:MAG: HEPN domain-containing protein [Deltaproteobacteria bacterium]|nr:HEPN domain-containing protein [Deltaproteobacteria bacterium]
MNVSDDPIVKNVRQWLTFADEDLNLAKHGLTLTTGIPYRLIAYHAQQCVEKHLKAYLVFRGIDFPYTHNISLLLELCAESADWTADIQDAEELSPYAVTARYPGEDEEVTSEEASRAIEIADDVRNTVRLALTNAGFQL